MTAASRTQRPAGLPDDVVRPLERAEVVWRRAIKLSGPAEDTDWFKVVLDLLRTAHHGPSTMLHALAIGKAQLRATPADNAVRDAVGLLTRAVAWMGKRSDDGEVGAAGSVGTSWRRRQSSG